MTGWCCKIAKSITGSGESSSDAQPKSVQRYRSPGINATGHPESTLPVTRNQRYRLPEINATGCPKSTLQVTQEWRRRRQPPSSPGNQRYRLPEINASGHPGINATGHRKYKVLTLPNIVARHFNLWHTRSLFRNDYTFLKSTGNLPVR